MTVLCSKNKLLYCNYDEKANSVNDFDLLIGTSTIDTGSKWLRAQTHFFRKYF